MMHYCTSYFRDLLPSQIGAGIVAHGSRAFFLGGSIRPASRRSLIGMRAMLTTVSLPQHSELGYCFGLIRSALTIAFLPPGPLSFPACSTPKSHFLVWSFNSAWTAKVGRMWHRGKR